MKPLLVLRPEPGNSATAGRARAEGLDPIQCPLFEVEAVSWVAPDPADFDALLVTSANALRCGGAQLESLTRLDALAVGSATAEAARAAGFNIILTGAQGVDALVDALPGRRRLLYLAGADRHRPASRHSIETVIVYRSVIVADPAIPCGALVALVHSARAGARLADVAPDRSAVSIAAISEAAAAACGPGWAALFAVDQPNNRALLALAARLCQD